jgi:PhoH-like ATPase
MHSACRSVGSLDRQLDSNSNGLTYLVEAFKGQKVYGHVLLDKSERSKLAELAAELL